MAKYTVCILDNLFTPHTHERRVLGELDADIIVSEPQLPEPELIRICQDADGLLVNRAFITRDLIYALPKLKVISAYGVGAGNVDIVAANERKIAVASQPGYCAEEVSEHAIMLLLATARKLIDQTNKVKSREVGWTQEPFRPIYRLAGKTLGIVGLGAIGRLTARKAQGLGMSIIACDPYISEETARQANVELVSLTELFRRADHVALHVGVTPETKGMIDATLLRSMKPTATLVNTGRGPVIDQDDLVTALTSGWLASAALDVVREDPPSEETYATLIALPNVVVTPHTAWYSEESKEILQTNCARNVALVLSGDRPLHTVNPEIYG